MSVDTPPTTRDDAETPARGAPATEATDLAAPGRLTPGLGLREYSVLGAVAILFVALAAGSSAFLSRTNLLNIADQSVTLGIVAAAGTLVIIAGGFDLSVGAIFAITGIVAAKLAPVTGGAPALALGALSGLGFGLLNGLLVTVGRINSFLATLGSSFVINGIATVVTGGYIITVGGSAFATLGTGGIAGVKYTILILLAWACLCGLILWRTALGRGVYAVGDNAAVARLSGVNVPAVRAITFCLSGLAAGIAGVLAASHLGQAQTGTGSGLELSAIAAVAIGGTSILGGRGAVSRTVAGVALLALINNGLNLLNVSPALQQVASGMIILVALGLDALSRSTATPRWLRRRP